MKLLAYTTFTKAKEVVDLQPDEVKSIIPQLFARGYNRILAKWKGAMFVLELVEDANQHNGFKPNIDDIVYTKTAIQYHPYQDQLP